jgi:hypothetical protein
VTQEPAASPTAAALRLGAVVAASGPVILTASGLGRQSVGWLCSVKSPAPFPWEGLTRWRTCRESCCSGAFSCYLSSSPALSCAGHGGGYSPRGRPGDLFMYLEPDRVMSLIAECAARFPGGRLFFDSIPARLRNRTMKGYRLSARYTAPPMPFSLSVSEAVRLPAQIPGVATAEDLQPPLGRKAWRSRTLRKIAALPGPRDLRPSITLLSFAAHHGR